MIPFFKGLVPYDPFLTPFSNEIIIEIIIEIINLHKEILY